MEEDDEDEEDEEDELSELPSTVTAAAATSSSSASKKKSTASQRRRSSGTGTKGGKTAAAAKSQSDNTSETKAKKKRSASDAELDEDASTATVVGAATAERSTAGARKKFAHLKPRTRHISQSLITTKWRPAPLPAQHAARALFVAAKRPVVEAAGRRGAETQAGYDHRRAEAEATLAGVLRKLEKQLPRIPFPGSLHQRGAGAEVFELEKVVERNRELEAQLTPAVHAVKLLREAVAREEGVLEGEREALDVLRARAREAERVGRERRKKGLHPALKKWRGRGGEVEDGVEDIRLAAKKKAVWDVEGEVVDEEEEMEADEELAPVLEQLRGHLDSMRGNMEQVEGLDDAMTGARVALDGVLRKRVTDEQYEGLISSS